MIKTAIAVIGIARSSAIPPAASALKIQGLITKLNQPGTICVRITVGSVDGIEKGDEVIVRRNGKPIGKLKVTKVLADILLADIVEAKESLERGDSALVEK